jgi:hypothetical protein
MPERGDYTEVVRAGTPLKLGPVALLPVERVVLRADRRDALACYAAVKELYALIVRDAEGVRALDCAAVTVPLEALREKLPDLDSVLAAM